MPTINAPTPDATTTAKGKIQLAGDLAGTAALPTVAKVNGYDTWWQELGRTTLATAGDVITVSSLVARKYLKLSVYTYSTAGTTNLNITFNGDTATNYSARVSANGAADGAGTAQSSLGLFQGTAADDKYLVSYMTNTVANNKQLMGTMLQQGGTGAPGRLEFAGTWVNTSAQVSSVTVTNTGTGDFAIGSEVIVLGHN